MTYENILIGDFIYFLGFAAGKKGLDAGKVDLYQQTPGDPIIGDLLTQWGGKNLIIEFKRNKNLLETELKKPSKDFLLKTELKERLLAYSMKGHLISYPERGELFFNCYISIGKYHKSDPISFKGLFERLLGEKIGLEQKQMEEYIKLLVKNSGKPDSCVLVNFQNGRKPIVLDLSQGYDLSKKIEIKNEIDSNLGRKRGLSR